VQLAAVLAIIAALLAKRFLHIAANKLSCPNSYCLVTSPNALLLNAMSLCPVTLLADAELIC